MILFLAALAAFDAGWAASPAPRPATSGNAPPNASLVLIPNSGAFSSTAMMSLVTDPLAPLFNALVPRPSYLTPFSDPVFGTRITRITEDAPVGFSTSFGTGTWGTDARHHYMTDQPWNIDGTLIAIENEGTPRQIFLDGETYEVVLLECPNYPRRDDRWHPTMANVRINVKNDELHWFDVVNCTMLRSWTLPFTPKGIGDGAGNPSADGRYLALADSTKIFVVDMDPQPPYAPYPNVRIGPIYDFSNCIAPDCGLGWVSMSPSGKYVVLKYSGDYPQVFDMDPTTLALTPRPLDPATPRCTGTAAQGYIYDTGHGELAINPFDNDEDVMVGQEHCGNRGSIVGGELMGGVVMVRLSDGAVTSLTDPTNEAYPHHISTRNYARPGWVYAGYYPDPGKRFSDELIAIKMDGSKSVERLAHLHSLTTGCYRCEAHAVPSPDGRRAIWASNWGIHCTECGDPSEIKAYLVDTRAPMAAAGPYDEPLILTADATGSFDSDGTILSYTFGFDDGTVYGPQRAPYATHTLIAGTRQVTVTVEDDLGATQVAVQSITVQGVDRAPIVSADPTAVIAADGTLRLGVTATDPNNEAIASLSTDLSGLPAGHGAVFTSGPDNESGTFAWNPTSAHVGGPYTVTFTAANNLQGSAVSAVTVTAANQAPAAALALAPDYGFAPMSVAADASASSDPDGSIVSYTFDFGDGTVIGPQASPVASHTLAEGTWMVSVLTEDDHGATSAANVPATALANLITNPSFESSLDGWKESGGANLQRVTTALDGAMALEMTGPTTTDAFGVNDSPSWIDPASGAGSVYHFSAWVRSASANGSAVIKIREYLDGVRQGESHYSARVPLSPVWQELSTDYVVRVDGTKLDLSVVNEPVSASEVFEVDLVRAGEVTSSPPLAVGDSPASGLSAAVSPNPVLDHGTLLFDTRRPGPLRVAVFDASGRRVLNLLDDASAPAGRHRLTFSALGHGGVPLRPGVYFYRVQAGEQAVSGRFLILR